MSPRIPDPVSLPLEVFEMIVGAVNFVDLPNFLQTSKPINVLCANENVLLTAGLGGLQGYSICYASAVDSSG